MRKGMLFENANEDGYEKLWRVDLLFKGAKYGRNDCLTWDKDEPGIEFHCFYDKNIQVGKRKGVPNAKTQLVSRYYVETLFGKNAEEPVSAGLDLLGYVPEWKINQLDLEIIRMWVERELKEVK